MRAETAFRVIIPTQSLTVKKMMSGLLDGLPVSSSDYGLTLDASITCSEVEVGIRKLEVVERDVMVPSRFKRGDIHAQLHEPEFNVVRLQWLAGVKERIPDPEVRRRYLSALSSYGAVAKMWPVEKRVGGHCWSYYRDNPPGSAESVVSADMVQFFRSVRCERRADDFYVTLRSTRGKGGRLFVTREDLEEMLALVDGEVKP